jgi:hypothetical protein
MSAEPKPDFSELADFADTLRKQCLRNEHVVRRALNRAKAHYPVPLADELNDVACSLREARSVRIIRAASKRASRAAAHQPRSARVSRRVQIRVDPKPVARHGLGLAGDFALEGCASSRPFGCRMRLRAVAASGANSPTALYWNFTEETDEDLF